MREYKIKVNEKYPIIEPRKTDKNTYIIISLISSEETSREYWLKKNRTTNETIKIRINDWKRAKKSIILNRIWGNIMFKLYNVRE